MTQMTRNPYLPLRPDNNFTRFKHDLKEVTRDHATEPPTEMDARVESKADVLLKKLSEFYTEEHFGTLKEALEGTRRVSLRVLDWLVTNYAKKNNVVYSTRVDGCSVAFNMFLEYKCQLKAYSKKHFDMFCRRERIEFRGVRTTVGQLNFFKWAITSGVLEYSRAHHDTIEQDMLASIQHRFHVTPQETVKRAELSKAAIKTCTSTKVTVKVKFT